MDLINGLTEDYLAAIASYKLQQLLLGATCSDWGDEPIPRKPTLVRNLLCQAHMHLLFYGERTHTYDYLGWTEAHSSILLEC